MRKTMPWLISALLGATIASTMTWKVISLQPAAPPEPITIAAPKPTSYADAIRKAAPAVVNFYATKPPSSKTLDDLPGSAGIGGEPSSKKARSLGSGVILNTEGLLITNHHVIKEARNIRALLHDGRDLPAEVLGHDPDTDLALLKIDAEQLPEVFLAQEGELQTGDLVFAIGYPYGLGQAASMGIISALGRSGLNLNKFEDYIQTDAAINSGSSGGALINTEGEIIGISTAILTESGGSQGIGFAIPAHLALDVVEALLEDGRVRRGWLGILPETLEAQTAKMLGLPTNTGIRVKAIAPHTPASKAGLLEGDIIVRVGEEVVGDEYQALKAVAAQPPGSKVDIHILRDTKPLILQVEVAERPQNNQ